jgi:membrane-associated protein
VDPKHLLETFGTAGLLAIVFAETGLLIGFFLPGDSLLVLAGLFCAIGNKAPVHLNLAVMLVGLFLAATLGAQTGWFIGHRAGPALFNRPESRLFKHEHVEKAQRFFERYGGRTIILARFVAIVRTFANPVAGVAGMPGREFAVYNVIGGFFWTVGLTMLGYVLGKQVPSAEDHLVLIEAIIIAVSIVPVAIEVLRSRRKRGAGRGIEPQRLERHQ